MRRRVYWQQIHLGGQRESGLAELGLDQALAGYILDQQPSPSPGLVRVWGYVVVVSGRLGEPDTPLHFTPSALQHRRQLGSETGVAKAAPSSNSGAYPL